MTVTVDYWYGTYKCMCSRLQHDNNVTGSTQILVVVGVKRFALSIRKPQTLVVANRTVMPTNKWRRDLARSSAPLDARSGIKE